MTIKLIVATDLNGAIGYQNKLLYHVPEDLKRFKELTSGHFVIMGRKTFESLPNGALPNRTNVVLTRDKNYKDKIKDKNVIVSNDAHKIINHYLESGKQDKDLWIIGGTETYNLFYSYVDELYITKIHKRADEADSYFHVYDEYFELDLDGGSSIHYSKKEDIEYQFNLYKRK